MIEARRWLLALLGLAPSVIACRTRAIGSPPKGPELATPTAAIPPDLELTVRVALARLKRSLGAPAMTQLQQQSQRSTPLGDPLILQALEHTTTAWAALRLGLDPAQTDNVLVLKGDFSAFRPRRPEWSLSEDLGGAWQRWDRSSQPARALPARIYTLAGELIVFVSEAEIDAVERRLNRGATGGFIEPPERGLVSIASSMPALAQAIEATAPRAARLLAQGTLLTGYAEFEHSGVLRLDLDFAFAEPKVAERTQLAASVLVTSLIETRGPLAALAQQIEIEALGRSVSVRLSLTPAELGQLLGCRGPEGTCS